MRTTKNSIIQAEVSDAIMLAVLIVPGMMLLDRSLRDYTTNENPSTLYKLLLTHQPSENVSELIRIWMICETSQGETYVDTRQANIPSTFQTHRVRRNQQLSNFPYLGLEL